MYKAISLAVGILALVIAVATPEIRQMVGLEAAPAASSSTTMPQPGGALWTASTADRCQVLAVEFYEETAASCFLTQSLSIEDYCQWRWKDEIDRSCTNPDYARRHSYNCSAGYRTMKPLFVSACAAYTERGLRLLSLLQERGDMSSFNDDLSSFWTEIGDPLYLKDPNEINESLPFMDCVLTELSQLSVITDQDTLSAGQLCTSRYPNAL